MSKKTLFYFFLGVFITACDTYYYVSFENRSNSIVILAGRHNSLDGERISPKTTRYLGWDEKCQKVIVNNKVYFLNTSKAPHDALTIGRAGTTSFYRVFFDGNGFYYSYSAKKKTPISTIGSCAEFKSQVHH